MSQLIWTEKEGVYTANAFGFEYVAAPYENGNIWNSHAECLGAHLMGPCNNADQAKAECQSHSDAIIKAIQNAIDTTAPTGLVGLERVRRHNHPTKMIIDFRDKSNPIMLRLIKRAKEIGRKYGTLSNYFSTQQKEEGK